MKTVLVSIGCVVTCVVLLALVGRTVSRLDPLAPAQPGPAAPESPGAERAALERILERAMTLSRPEESSPAGASEAAARVRAGIPGALVTLVEPPVGVIGLEILRPGAVRLCLGTARQWACVVRAGGVRRIGHGASLELARAALRPRPLGWEPGARDGAP